MLFKEGNKMMPNQEVEKMLYLYKRAVSNQNVI